MDGELERCPRGREIFCNRSLNLKSIKAIGYDMDYTLVHYEPKVWEGRAFEHLKRMLLAQGLPVEGCAFDPDFTIRGLVIDTERGNLLKANRFGYAKRGFHGTRRMSADAIREGYGRTIIDAHDKRWAFLHTFFSLSEGCMYAQLVDLLDAGKLPNPFGYETLQRLVRSTLDAAHMEGRLKQELVSAPEKFVVLDPDTVRALVDQKRAGKKLLLVTNSEFAFTDSMMRYAFDRFLGEGTSWRSLFDVIIVGARKPDFFSTRSPLFKIVNDQGYLLPSTHGLEESGVYFGGSAALLEEHLRLDGEEILYVGDHIAGDVTASKDLLRWRTCLILRELEVEIAAVDDTRADEETIGRWMEKKEALERRECEVKLALLHLGDDASRSEESKALQGELFGLHAEQIVIDEAIEPLARAESELTNPRWGLLLRTANDKSQLARQLERSADVYTSRVSNFLFATPFAHFRSPRGSMAHDPQPGSRAVGGPDQRPA